MSDTFEMDLTALNTLAVDLGRIPAKIVPLARKVLEKSSADIEKDAKLFCPVDTGNLRASIGRTIKGLSAEIGSSTSYAPHVEWGTSRMAPSAFLGPAFDRHAGQFEQALGKIAQGLL